MKTSWDRKSAGRPEEAGPKKFVNPDTGSVFTLDGVIKMIQDIISGGRGLTQWEEDFVANVSAMVDNTGNITEPQLKVLERIYANKT